MKTFYDLKADLEKDFMSDRDAGYTSVDEYKKRMATLDAMHEKFVELVYKKEVA